MFWKNGNARLFHAGRKDSSATQTHQDDLSGVDHTNMVWLRASKQQIAVAWSSCDLSVTDPEQLKMRSCLASLPGCLCGTPCRQLFAKGLSAPPGYDICSLLAAKEHLRSHRNGAPSTQQPRRNDHKPSTLTRSLCMSRKLVQARLEISLALAVAWTAS